MILYIILFLIILAVIVWGGVTRWKFISKKRENLKNFEKSLRKICVISTKNPTHILLDTITNVKKYYPNFDIVVIDSDSDNFDMFKNIPGDVKVEYIKNKNWELGAWFYAYNKYNKYDIYMFIQDTLTPVKTIPLDYENIINSDYFYSFHYSTRLKDGGDATIMLGKLRNVYNNTKLQFIADMDGNTQITGAAHSSFITNSKNTKIILELEDIYMMKKLKKNKEDAGLSERTVGIMADKHRFRRIDMTGYFKKNHGGRMERYI